MAKIKIEGQTINGASVGITDEIAKDDDLLKAALAPTWPDVRTATFRREGGTDGKELVVTVQKKAGTKGVADEGGNASQLWFSVDEAAPLIGDSPDTIYRDIRAGQFPFAFVKIGKRIKISAQSLLDPNAQEVFDAKRGRTPRDAERVRKLEAIALAAKRFLRAWGEFDGGSSVGEYIDALDKAVEGLGADEIARIKAERRGA